MDDLVPVADKVSLVHPSFPLELARLFLSFIVVCLVLAGVNWRVSRIVSSVDAIFRSYEILLLEVFDDLLRLLIYL